MVAQIEVVTHGQHGTRRAYLLISAQPVIGILDKLHHLLGHRSTQSAGEIIEEIAARAHRILNGNAEHPHGEHIEEDVRPAGMHEHIGEHLVEVEV